MNSAKDASVIDPRKTISAICQRVARVLVIDDEPCLAECMREVLSDEFEVTATTRSVEAYVWLSGGDWYDVVLCDVMMPAMSGIELHQRVHAAHPDLAARIVFMTGTPRGAQERRTVDELPNLVLEKPLDLDAVRELVRRRACVEPPAYGARTARGGPPR